MTCRLQWCGRNWNQKIPIWRTFGWILWHVIQEPRITLHGAATWWILSNDSRATCHVTGCSQLARSMSWSCRIAGCKNSIRHIENRFSLYCIFLLLMQFTLWRVAVFVSSPIYLFYRLQLILFIFNIRCQSMVYRLPYITQRTSSILMLLHRWW